MLHHQLVVKDALAIVNVQLELPRPSWAAWRWLAELLSCLVLTAAPASQNSTPQPVGEAMTRELMAGEAHVNRVELAAGQPCRLAVEQQGIDVTVALMTVTGNLRIAVDSPFDRQGTESLLVMPEQGGEYTVEVRAREQGLRGATGSISTCSNSKPGLTTLEECPLLYRRIAAPG